MNVPKLVTALQTAWDFRPPGQPKSVLPVADLKS